MKFKLEKRTILAHHWPSIIAAGICCSFATTVQAQTDNIPPETISVFQSDSTPVAKGQSTAGSLALVQGSDSPDKVWSDSNTLGRAAVPNGELNVNAVDPRESVLNLDQLKTVLEQAPLEISGVAKSQQPPSSTIFLPSPDGGFVEFSIHRTQVLSPEMEAKAPGATTYSGHAVSDRATTIVMDLTSLGFHAQVLQPGKRWFIDPQFRESTPRYVSYYKARSASARHCELESHGHTSAFSHFSPSPSRALMNRSGDFKRSYDLAVAFTGEYGAFFGSAADGINATITTINRVRGVYEKELAISFNYNWVVAHDDPATDPFTGNNNAGTLINESQTVIDSNVGDANYDIGHTFSTGAGGLAGLGVVCTTGQKARGVTGSSNPTGDAYDVDYVAHEIGHQFAGNHTFNGTNGNCTGSNRNGNTAYEPGSGSTIQAYAGICGADNLQSNSDAQMAIISHIEMRNYVENGSGSTCGTLTTTGNSVPVPDASGNVNIPHSTPFILVGSGTDADGDSLTYSWEQVDLGPQAALSAPDDGAIPLFRVLPPSSSSARFFPNFPSVEANTSSDSEKLPTLGRTMAFTMTTRDGSGGVEYDYITATVDGSSGPFEVTYPNGGETVSGGMLVTWDVAGTDSSPISASTVDISLSLSGSGLTYNDLLLDDTPNDGSEWVDLSGFSSSNARIVVAQNLGSNHSFYDISNNTFAINAYTAPTCAGHTVTVDLNLNQVPTGGNDVIYGTPSGETINGLGGNDIICGGNGYDVIYGGSGSDTLYGGDGFTNDNSYNDLYGGTGNDSLFGTTNQDFLYGQGGVDVLETYSLSSSSDILHGGTGNDLLRSRSHIGGSRMNGGGNNDTIYGSNFDDIIEGSDGTDTIYGKRGNDEITGGKGPDSIYSGPGDDTINGNGGSDILKGSSGNDTIIGAKGNDLIDGGSGTDTCSGGSGTDTENNCETSTGFPRIPSTLVATRPTQSGRQQLSEIQIQLIDNCNLTVEECVAKENQISLSR